MDDKISVIVTVYNEAASIQMLLETLFNQHRLADEIIIVDGQSTDGTLEILKTYHANGKIKLICEKCNIARGRNLGIAQASHELIAITDAGCTIDPDWLKNIEKCFINERADIVSGNYRFDTHSAFEQAIVLATDTPGREASDAATYQPSSRSIAFKKSAWLKAKGYPEWLYAAEDTLFNDRLKQLGFRFVFCQEAIVRWRPRQTWKALMKQYFNYARGNARVGISTSGYLANLYYHSLFLSFALLAIFWPLFWIAALMVLVRHIQKHLWQQAVRVSNQKKMRYRVLLIMEWVRLAGMAGFITGRLECIIDPGFIQNLKRWQSI